MKIKTAVGAISCALSVTACASNSSDIAAAYVSPTSYASFACPQLREEASRVSSRAALAMGTQDQRATNDKVAMGVGLVVFWPALLFTKGDGASAAEVARLKGEMEAIEQASIQKRCGIQFQRQATS